MSPFMPDGSFDITRVAVIGAGPCGLAATKYLLAENRFASIQVFDQRAEVGGLWNYTPLNQVDDDFRVPRTTPTTLPDRAIRTPGADAGQFISPLYSFLETNIPNTLMNYSDVAFPQGSSLFPKHDVVKRYLTDYARELAPMLVLQTQVLSVRKTGDPDPVDTGRWEVEVLDLQNREKRTLRFDAIMVATGHYSDPFIPDIPGLAEFNRRHPGAVSHSKYFRSADEYKGKKVIVVGHQASGLDISAQVSRVCDRPVLISEKKAPVVPMEERPWAKMVPQITEIVPKSAEFRFANGAVETGVDAVIFCTGYFYSYPFLQTLDPPVITDGSYARELWQHMLYIEDPTLCFLGVPQRVVPFPIAEAQSAFVARAWSGRLKLTPKCKMRAWLDSMIRDKGESKLLHNLAFPKDIAYINHLHALSLAASRWDGLENNGAGKTPPYWGPEKAWTRERFPLIKIASRALGEKRHEVQTLVELGFDFQKWEREQEETNSKAA
ncbi:thiol-specific monooxygenase [Thozetella sp. PMI_491]|nr:thiol-specific monooxygenase [Thozetella sp. PMI_491]